MSVTLPPTSEDWIKELSWGFPDVTTLDGLRGLAGHGRPADAWTVCRWMGRYRAARPMPDALFADAVAWVTGEGAARYLPLWAQMRAATAPRTPAAHASLGRGRTAYVDVQARDWRGRWAKEHGDGAPPQPPADELPAFAGSEYAPYKPLADGKGRWLTEHGLEPSGTDFARVMVDPYMQARIADAYDALPMDQPEAHAAYDELAAQVGDQYRYLTGPLGVRVEFTDHDPYRDAGEMVADLRENGRLQVLRTAATGSHAYLSDEANDQFRAVHDAFGHAAIGRGFDRNGEEAAFQSHAEMFTGQAVRALATETRGQNAALIVRGDFPPQKVGLLPDGLDEVAANRPDEPMALAAAVTGADADNLYELTGVHHVSIGRRLSGQPDTPRTAAPRRTVAHGARSSRRTGNPELARARRVLERLTALRRDTGRQLLAGAEVAFAEAMRHAGVRATTKARNRSGATLARTIASALEGNHSLSPYFAALGINEADLLNGAFGSYETQARSWLERRRRSQVAALESEGYDDAEDLVPGDETTIAAAAAFLAAALLALGRTRILSGQDPVDLSGPGEISGLIPATLAAQALRIADGGAVVTHAATADLLPEVAVLTDAVPLEARIALRLRDALLEGLAGELVPAEAADRPTVPAGDPIEYLWVHGFYGEPRVDFPPHAELGEVGFTTLEPDTDPRLYHDEPFPPSRLYQPADHDGCTCEWVPTVATALADAADAAGIEPYTGDEVLDVLARAEAGTDAGAPVSTTRAGAAWDETAHPRAEHGRFGEKPGTEPAPAEPPAGQAQFPMVLPEPTPQDERWAAAAVSAADSFTGGDLGYADEIALRRDEGNYEADSAALEDAGFQPGTPEAQAESIGQWVKSFENSSAIYEAAQALQGAEDPRGGDAPDPDMPGGAANYAYARELLECMATGTVGRTFDENNEPSDETAVYSPFAVGGEYDGPAPAFVMTATEGDELVRGVGDRGIVDGFREAQVSGEPVEWPMAAFVWGQNFESYTNAAYEMSGENPPHTDPVRSALEYALKDGYPPVILSLHGQTEGAFVIDGEYEVLTGGKFRVTDVRAEEIPTGGTDPFNIRDDELDNWQFTSDTEVGPTETVTWVDLEQVEGPRGVLV